MLYLPLFLTLLVSLLVQSVYNDSSPDPTQALDDSHSGSNDTVTLDDDDDDDDDDTYLTIPSYRHHGAGAPQFCDNRDGFWDSANEEESEWGTALYQWSMNVDKESSKWRSKSSEAAFFADDVLGIDNFDCGIGIDNGCDGMPDCDTVLTRMVDKEDARRVMFVLESYKNFALRAAKLLNVIPAVEHKMIGFANEMSSVLYPKHDYVKETECAALANIVKIGSSILLTLPSVIVPFMGAPAALTGGIVSAEVAGIAATSATRVSKMGRLKNMVRKVGNSARSGQALKKIPTKLRSGISTKIPRLSPGMGKRIGKSFTRGGSSWVKADKVMNTPLAKLVNGNSVTALLIFGGDEISDRICNRYPNPPADLEPWYAMGGQMQGQVLLENYGREISDRTTEMLSGVGFGPEGTFDDQSISVLTDLVADGSYVQLSPEEEERYYNRPYILEEELFEVFKRAFISMTLKLQMCYLACTDNPNKPGPNRYWVDDTVWCQPQCWGRFGEDKNNALYGIDYLDRNEMTKEFLLGSYRNWRDFRYGNNPELPRASETDRFLKAAQGDFLPVCFSRAMPPRDMKNPGAEDNAQTLPCVCGNDQGNETMVFFRETNMDVLLTGATNSALSRACQWGADEQEVLPSLNFIMQCDIGYHWPVHGEEHSHHMHYGPDPHCGEVISLQEEMVHQGKTLEEVNCEVCDEKKELWQQITESQHNHKVFREQDKNKIIGAFEMFVDMIYKTRDQTKYSHREACKRFQKKHGDACKAKSLGQSGGRRDDNSDDEDDD